MTKGQTKVSPHRGSGRVMAGHNGTELYLTHSDRDRFAHDVLFTFLPREWSDLDRLPEAYSL